MRCWALNFRILLILWCVVGPSQAFRSAIAADASAIFEHWAEFSAEKSAEDLMVELEGKIKIDGNPRRAISGTAKNLIKSAIVSQFTGDVHSPAMQGIVNRISSKLGGYIDRTSGQPNQRRCRLVAASVGSTVVYQIRREVDETFNMFSNALLNASAAAGRIANAARGLANEIRQAIEDLVDSYLEDLTVETLRREVDVSATSATVYVIWYKNSNTFSFLVVGDSNCNEKAHHQLQQVKAELGCWVIQGTGQATWRGVEYEEANPGQSSAVAITVDEPNIVANCCLGGREPQIDLWQEMEAKIATRQVAPDTSTSTEENDQAPDPEQANESEGTTTNPRSGSAEGTEENDIPPRVTAEQRRALAGVPEVPDGPVCEHEKDLLLRRASIAINDAREGLFGDNREQAEANLALAQETFDRLLQLTTKPCQHDQNKSAAASDKDQTAALEVTPKTDKDGISQLGESRPWPAANWGGNWLWANGYEMPIAQAGSGLTGHFHAREDGLAKWEVNARLPSTHAADATYTLNVEGHTAELRYLLQLSPSSRWILGRSLEPGPSNLRPGHSWGLLYYKAGISPQTGHDSLIVQYSKSDKTPAVAFLVTLTDATSNFRRSQVTDYRGWVEFAEVPQGDYSLTISRQKADGTTEVIGSHIWQHRQNAELNAATKMPLQYTEFTLD